MADTLSENIFRSFPLSTTSNIPSFIFRLSVICNSLKYESKLTNFYQRTKYERNVFSLKVNQKYVNCILFHSIAWMFHQKGIN